MMSIDEKLNEHYLTFIHKLDKDVLSKGVVIAFSGGPDSRALLDLACRNGTNIQAYYFIHNLRNAREQQAELDLVSSICGSCKVPLETGFAEPGEIIRQGKLRGIGTEAYARELRYDGLEKFRQSSGCGYVFTAHTMDDDVETMLMRFLSGSIRAQGIPAVRGSFARPLIGISKEELLAYLAIRDLKYSLDLSNASPVYLRNRVRLEILPVIRKVFPSFNTSAVKMKTLNRSGQEFVDFAVHALLPWRYKDSRHEWEIPVKDFFDVPRYGRIMSILHCMNSLFCGSFERVPMSFFNDLPDEICGQQVLLKGHGIVLERRKDKLVLRMDSFDSQAEYVYILSEGRAVTAGGVEFILAENAADGWQPILRMTNGMEKKLFVRSPRPGDSIVSGNFRKQIKKLLAEWNVPVHARTTVPVLTDGNSILGVFAQGAGGKNQLCNNLIKATMVSSKDDHNVYVMYRGV